MIRQFLCAAALTAVCIGAASAQDASDEKAKVTLVYDHELPNVPGKSIRGVLVEYGPGGSSPAHTHPSSAFIYATVLEGAIRSQVNDGPVTTYRAGESWSENPGDRHARERERERHGTRAPARRVRRRYERERTRLSDAQIGTAPEEIARAGARRRGRSSQIWQRKRSYLVGR